MGNSAIVGINWGDEGKGRIIAYGEIAWQHFSGERHPSSARHITELKLLIGPLSDAPDAVVEEEKHVQQAESAYVCTLPIQAIGRGIEFIARRVVERVLHLQNLPNCTIGRERINHLSG